MGKKQKTNWWIDLFLFFSFIITFFLDVTGLSLHQLIGIFSILFAAYHLFIHRDWVKAVRKRFFKKVSGKSRIYYILDTLLLTGFALIGFTGLLISSWLNLTLPNYFLWLNIHIAISISSLALLLLKLTLHLKWIVQIARKIFLKPAIKNPGILAVQPIRTQDKQIKRREFLGIMGVISAASLFAIANGTKSLAETFSLTKTKAFNDSTSQSNANDDGTSQSYENEDFDDDEDDDHHEVINQATAIPQSQPPQSTTTSSSSDCIVRCSGGCSYPGRCRRYTDTNSNGLCDLGECL